MKAFLTLALVIITSSFATAQWYKLPGPLGGNMNTVARVGSEIWVGGNGGIYISTNEGLTWQKSPIANGLVRTILSFNDTIVICYNVVNGTAYNSFSISSFNGGQTWTNPYLLGSQTSILDGFFVKAARAIYFRDTFDYLVSTNGGQTWTVANTPSGYISQIYTDGIMSIASSNISGPPYNAYYYSLNGSTPWVLLDSTILNVSSVFINNNRIFFSVYPMGPDSILKTDNFGASWDTINTGAVGTSIFSIYEYDYNLYLQGNQDTLISSDNGLTWSPGTAPDYRLLRPGVNTVTGNWLFLDYYGEVTTYFPSNNTSLVTETGILAIPSGSLYQDNNEIFTSGNEKLYRSLDGGITWITDSINSNIDKMIFFGDSIYAVDQGFGLFARSYDHGATWYSDTIQTYTNSSTPSGIAKLNGTIYINGDASFFSNDEGMTSNIILSLPIGPYSGCVISNNDEHGTVNSYFGSLFSITASGHLFRYNFTGQNWDHLFCWTTPGAWAGNTLTQVENYLVMNSRNKLFMSSDSGNTWVESLYGGLPFDGFNYYIPKNMIHINGYWFCTMGSYGVYYSNDHGMNWTPLTLTPEFVATQGLCSLNGILYSISLYDGIWRRQNPFFTLSGNVYFDLNNNSIRDVGEAGIKNRLLITTPGNFVATSDTAGDYSLISDMPGNITVTIPSPYAIINPITQPYSGASSNLDFGVHVPANIDDLTCDITNSNVFAPGFPTYLHLTISNSGSMSNTPQLKFVLDTALNYISANPPPNLISGDTLYWDFAPIDFLEEATVNLYVYPDTNTTIGDTLICTLEALPIIGDTVPGDNIYILEEEVVGSFDPNDKTCLQGDYFTPTQLANGEELEYVIRFQNTGNLQTSFIVLTDTLSSLLDISTFRMISSSHPCTWSMSGLGNLRVEYDPINLPPSSVDEPGSHGFFKYAVKCREAVVAGNAIDNTAAIFFDFNTPIITNTVTTLISDPIPVFVPEITPTIVHILPYPNPSSDYIRIKFTNNTYPSMVSVYTFDVLGNLVSTTKLNPTSEALNISSYAQGIYFAVVTDQNRKRLGSFKFTKVD